MLKIAENHVSLTHSVPNPCQKLHFVHELFSTLKSCSCRTNTNPGRGFCPPLQPPAAVSGSQH